MSAVRTIFVTGANQGLGFHTVHSLAKTPSVLVFMGSRKVPAAEEAIAKFASEVHESSTVVPVQLDITDAESIKNAHAFVSEYLQKKNLSGLDVLVNNAAITGPTFEAAYAVNVFGTVHITDALRPLINKNGAILNISSTLGSLAWFTERPPPPIYLPYSTSKSALNAITLHWAIQEEEKKEGVRVVSICPGFNATNLNAYTGTMDPKDGCQVIVKAALAKEGPSGVFFNKDGPVRW
ncbi:short-chain dehydrogenase/reductase SDR [Mycena polygramma]|nr:short-chain dehydrogenase/reductase SDR [Mycena polygramma]